ncbi:MAG: hypothetical protein JST54_36000 [Deltaproteobacteria bacterium]|nr:hypothetical protein [Deltaproteobacteria bacterium]
MSRFAKYFNVPLEQFLDSIWKAVNEKMPAGAKVSLGGKTYTKPQLLDQIHTMRKPYAAVNDAHDTLRRLIGDRDGTEEAALTFIKSYASAITSAFGATQDVADSYGLLDRQAPRQLSIEEKLAAKSKRLATRAARKTMGKRQKEDVKATGDFTVTVTPPGASQPTASAPTAQPVITAAPAPVVSAAPALIAAPVASTPVPTPSSSGDVATVPSGTNGVSNGSVAPMLMNGAGH